MTVAELEELLAMLPAEMGVCLRMSGLACRHIDKVDKQPSRRVIGWVHRAMDSVLKAATVHVDGRHPPMLVLEAGMSAPMWCHAFADQVEFTVAGRWPQRKQARR